MVAVSLDDVTSSYASAQKINSNFDKITVGLADSVSKSTGGVMTSDIDMNSQQLLNLPYATLDGHAVSKEYLEAYLTSVGVVPAVADITVYASAYGVDAANLAAINDEALQDAIDYASTIGGTVELPEGSILFNSFAINASGVKIKGQGAHNTILTSSYIAAPNIVLGNGVTRTDNYQFRDIGFIGATGGTMFFTRYIRGLYVNNFYESTDRFMKLGDETITNTKPTYIVHLTDAPDSSQVASATLSHIECYNMAGQLAMRDVFIEGQYSTTVDGFTVSNNIQARCDHILVSGGYFSRFRDNWNFEDGRVTNSFFDTNHLSEGAYRHAVNYSCTSGSAKAAANVGWENCWMYGSYINLSTSTTPAINIASERVGAGTTLLHFGQLHMVQNYTPVAITNVAGEAISGVTFAGIDYSGAPADVNQSIISITGGSAGTTLFNISIGPITGQAYTNALASAVKISGRISKVAIDTNAIAVGGCTVGLDDQTSTTPLQMNNGALATTDLISVLDQSQAWSRPVNISNLKSYMLTGTATNDAAPVGAVGEYLESIVLAGAGVSLTSGSPANITTLSLTAGDWDVWATAGFTPAGGTLPTVLGASISTTSNTLATGPNNGAIIYTELTYPAGRPQILPVGTKRISIASTTTIYLVALAGFTVSTLTGYGSLAARRVR